MLEDATARINYLVAQGAITADQATALLVIANEKAYEPTSIESDVITLKADVEALKSAAINTSPPEIDTEALKRIIEAEMKDLRDAVRELQTDQVIEEELILDDVGKKG